MCFLKVTNLVRNVERYAFSIINSTLYHIKQELLQEIQNFPIKITVKDFLTIDRRVLAAVSI